MLDEISGIDRRDPNVKAILKALYTRVDAYRASGMSMQTDISKVPHIRGKHAECEWLIGQLEEPKGE